MFVKLEFFCKGCSIAILSFSSLEKCSRNVICKLNVFVQFKKLVSMCVESWDKLVSMIYIIEWLLYFCITCYQMQNVCVCIKNLCTLKRQWQIKSVNMSNRKGIFHNMACLHDINILQYLYKCCHLCDSSLESSGTWVVNITRCHLFYMTGSWVFYITGTKIMINYSPKIMPLKPPCSMCIQK